MTDTPERKTLKLARKPAAPSRDGETERRVRAGARARQVAQLERTREQQRTVRADASDDTVPRPSERAGHPAAGRRKPQRPSTAERVQAAELALNDAPARIERRRGKPMPHRATEIFPIFAPCPQGLEQALTAEMQALGFDDAQAGRAGCRFHADWTGVLRANLYSRLATRILVQVAHAPVEHEDDILELAMNTPWERWFGAEQTLRVDTSAIRSPMQSLQYCNLRAKDGICDRLRDREGERPSIDTVRPDARVHLFLDETSATLYLDTSGESLFKRGWRLDKGDAPIRENLAAGILALAGWDPSAALMDSFCGSGTVLIEAAWIALGVPAGIWRPFGFERLRNHDERHWRDLKADARARIATRLDAPLVGSDLDPRAIAAAELNRERAWLTPDTIRFEVGDARHVTPPAPTGWLVANPPYGERLDDADELWPAFAQNLKRNFNGWQVHMISSDMDLPKKMRLKPKRKQPLYNGSLECRLFGFEMVAASYRK